MIKKCLFPAAGYGTRFLPATKSMPKEMLPVVDTPLIQYGVQEALDAGLTEIAMVTGRGKRSLEDHFDISYELESRIFNTEKEKALCGIRRLIDGCSFSYTRQAQMKGLGHAILSGRPLIGDEPFAVLLADDLCLNLEGEGVLLQMVRLFNQFRCSIVAIQEVAEGETGKYGIIAGQPLGDDLVRVDRMVEKPPPGDAPSNLAIIGRYILTPDIFNLIAETPPGKGGEIQITDALMKQARQGCVLAYRFKGRRFDCGSAEGYVEATNFCFEHLYKPGQAERPAMVAAGRPLELATGAWDNGVRADDNNLPAQGLADFHPGPRIGNGRIQP